MTCVLQPIADPAAPLARRNPVAKLGAALLFSLPLLATLDPLTPALGLLVELALLPLFGLRYGTLARRAWPLTLAAAGILVTMVLFAADRVGPAAARPGPVRRHHRRAGRRARPGPAHLRGRPARRDRLRHHRPDRPGRRPGPERQGAGPVRDRRAGRVPAAAAARRRSGRCSPWPAAPGASTPAATRSPSCGCSSRPPSRCWSAPCAGAPGWRSRWTPAASTPASPAPTPAGRVSPRADTALLVGALVLAAAALTTTVAARPVPPHHRLRALP